ncbi:hypothetical protein [Mycolicibacterium elephantis]|uniref:hypothetical protein n=1 Tax=Mycolicibacterium elephantis TaxID=81858 RepID=UPI001055C6F0|nr:hypothetical protein [Mycolicibacterium elephantis]
MTTQPQAAQPRKANEAERAERKAQRTERKAQRVQARVRADLSATGTRAVAARKRLSALARQRHRPPANQRTNRKAAEEN